MTLNEYLQKEKLRVSHFAKANNLNQPTIWRIVKGKSRPSAATALAIEQITGGAVTIRELLYSENRGLYLPVKKETKDYGFRIPKVTKDRIDRLTRDQKSSLKKELRLAIDRFLHDMENGPGK